jgi:hypothetical protein
MYMLCALALESNAPVQITERIWFIMAMAIHNLEQRGRRGVKIGD